MTAAREKVVTVLQQLRQRQEKEQQAAETWQQARSRCLAIAKAVLEGAETDVLLVEDRLILVSPHGSMGQFAFDQKQLALIGSRWKPAKEVETFFSLRIEPPPRSQANRDGQWGPGRTEGGMGDLARQVGSQEAFEKAVADWFEWAYVGDGAPIAGA